MKINVLNIAKLANFSLTDEEIKKFEKQLSEVLQYIEKLNDVDTKNVIPTSQVTGLENVHRDDIVSFSLPQDTALSNSKKVQNGFFLVKGILDSE